MSIRRTTNSHVAPCPKCSASVVNVQGMRACERCEWTTGA